MKDKLKKWYKDHTRTRYDRQEFVMVSLFAILFGPLLIGLFILFLVSYTLLFFVFFTVLAVVIIICRLIDKWINKGERY